MELSMELNEELAQLKSYLTEWLKVSLINPQLLIQKENKELEGKYNKLLSIIRPVIENSTESQAGFYGLVMDISNVKEATKVLQELHDKQKNEIATIEALEEYGVKLGATCNEWEKQHNQKLPSILEIVNQNKTIIEDLKSINIFVNERLDAVEALQKDLKSGKLSDLEQKNVQEIISKIESEIDAILN